MASWLKYSNENHINIIPQKDFEDLTHTVFNVIAENISKSLGPLGSSATILDGMIIEATKDGYSILSKYIFHNRYKKMIYNLIKQPCTKMNNTVGDGTTTAITLTNNMFARYEKYKNAISNLYRLPRQLTAALDEVVTDLKTRVESKSRPINPEDYDTIYNIAYVVSNGNKSISDAVASAYRDAKSPAIKIKDSPNNTSFLQQVDGFEFPTNAIDVCYVRNQDLTAMETNVGVLVLNHCVTTDEFNELIVPINEAYRAMGRKLIVVASQYDQYFMESVLKQYVNYEAQKYKSLNLVLTQYKLGQLLPSQLVDLATILKTRVINDEISTGIRKRISEGGIDRFIESIDDDTDPLWRSIGQCESVLISTKNGCIFNPNKDIFEDELYKQAHETALAELKDAEDHTLLEVQNMASKVYDARTRVLQLEMKNYIYYVGADSRLQKQILEDAIDDVIKCLRSAVKYGVVPGCQLTIIQSCDEYLDELGDLTNVGDDIKLRAVLADTIRTAVMDTYVNVLIGPKQDGIIKTIPLWNKVTANGLDELRKMADEKTAQIISESIKRQEVFDLETLDYNPKIITSAQTDTMVLTAATELIKILISGNQCIFMDPDLNSSHQDEVDAYV